MICEPCRQAHHPNACIDSSANRAYPHRHCACQHRTAPEPAPGATQPEVEIATSTQTPTTSGLLR